ncbi:MAG: NAD(P)-dependent glycerol-3-phosphate dehydrogenase [Gammaproteobacteria bacterium]|nr:NAD(P)-dependent glycerol-3-phosphate dehydrogenase [Gammaproteobacteria bacterium]
MRCTSGMSVDEQPLPILVLGAGSWGSALAMLLARNGYPTFLWSHNAQHAVEMEAQRCNARYLPDIPFPEKLRVVADYTTVITQVRDILIAVPSHAFRDCLKQLAPHLRKEMRIAWATKGLEGGSHQLMHQVFAEVLGDHYPCALVSGPSFAKEVALDQPTAVTVASTDAQFANEFAGYLHKGNFRAYTNDDMVGVEVGGAAKNVLAIATGIADGLGYNANTRAALITRGLAEMMRLGIAAGGEPETFMGLAGLGDLVLTCSDNQSRNRRFGLALGQGKSWQQAVDEIQQVVEGVQAAKEIYELAAEYRISMPITEQVYRVLYEGLDPRDAVQSLLERSPTSELS